MTIPGERSLHVRGPATSLRLRLPPFGDLVVGAHESATIVVQENGVPERALTLELDFAVTVVCDPGADAIAVERVDGSKHSITPGARLELSSGDTFVIGAAEFRFDADLVAEPPSSKIWTLEAAERLRALDADRFVDAQVIRFAASETKADFGESMAEAAPPEWLLCAIDDSNMAAFVLEPSAGMPATINEVCKAVGGLKADITVLDGQPLSKQLGTAGESSAPPSIPDESTEPFGSLREEMAALEKKRILQALEKYGNQTEAAKALDIPIRTFVNRMDALGIPRARRSAGKGKDSE